MGSQTVNPGAASSSSVSESAKPVPKPKAKRAKAVKSAAKASMPKALSMFEKAWGSQRFEIHIWKISTLGKTML